MKNRSTHVELESIGDIIGDIKNPPTRRMPTGKKRGRPRKEVSNVRKLFNENAGLKEDLLFSLRRAVRGECVGEMEPLNGKVWCGHMKVTGGYYNVIRFNMPVTSM